METNTAARLLVFIEETTGKQVGLDTPLTELGDSLEFLDLLQAIANKYQKHIPDELIADADTVGDLLKALQ